MTNRVQVNIVGHSLTLETDRSPEHMDELARLLNDRVRAIQKSGVTNYLNAIVMASLALTDELVSIRGERDHERLAIEERSRELLEALDTAMVG